MHLKRYNPILSRNILFYIFFFCLLDVYSAEKKASFDILRSIRSPQELLYPVLPQKFCVPVLLSGSIADEMNGALKNLNLETPAYMESFDGSNFHLSIANESYPEQTSDLLSGVLNPLEMIDLIVQSLVKYKSTQKFTELISETNLELQKSPINPTTVKVHLTPRGNRFAYNYDDNGAFIQESFITEMDITIDTATHLVHEISTRKLHRQFSTDVTKEPVFDTLCIKYLFNYIAFTKDVLLPYQLQIFSNNKQTLEIGVTYRQEGENIVFDKKEMFSVHDSGRSELVISYGRYAMTVCKTKKNSVQQINKKLMAASALSKKAVDYLRKGNISASARVLREIAEKYDDTPQAIEARRLLSQLPSDLR
jgi:hypothetical protein